MTNMEHCSKAERLSLAEGASRVATWVSAARISCLVNALESVGMVVLRAKMEEVRCTCLDQCYHFRLDALSPAMCRCVVAKLAWQTNS